jgi:hypothetical protein
VSHLIRIWGNISRPDGTISHRQLIKVVRTLAPPIGTGPAASAQEAEALIQEIGVVPVPGFRYTFQHTVFALVAGVAEVPVPDNTASSNVKKQIAKHFMQVCSASAVTWCTPGMFLRWMRACLGVNALTWFVCCASG